MGIDEPFDLAFFDLVFELVVLLVILEYLEEEEVVLGQELIDSFCDEIRSHIVLLRFDFFVQSNFSLDYLKIFQQGPLMI